MENCCKNNEKKELKELNKKIEYFYVDGCHTWLEGIKELHETLIKNNFIPKFKIICISNKEDAIKYKFCGSPSIQIDGKDIDELAKFVKNYSMASCRPYIYEGKNYEFPPKNMIEKKLKN